MQHFFLLQTLATASPRSAVRCLNLMLPILYTCWQDASRDDRLLTVVGQLLIADGVSYVQMVRQWVSGAWIAGPVLELFRDVVVGHVRTAE